MHFSLTRLHVPHNNKYATRDVALCLDVFIPMFWVGSCECFKRMQTHSTSKIITGFLLSKDVYLVTFMFL